MKQKTYSFLMLILINSFVFGQETTTSNNAFNLEIGLNNTYVKDINFSPLNYLGNSYDIKFGYIRKTKKLNIFFSSLNLSSGVLKTNASNLFNSDRALGIIKIGYLKNVKKVNSKTNFYVGSQYKTYLSMMFYDGTRSFSFFGLHSVDIIGSFDYQYTNKHSINASVGLPIFGLLVRPPYSGIDKFLAENENNYFKIITNGKFTSLNNFFGLDFGLSYKYKLSKKWDLLVSNHFHYYKTKWNDINKSIDNSITVGTQFNF